MSEIIHASAFKIIADLQVVAQQLICLWF